MCHIPKSELGPKLGQLAAWLRSLPSLPPPLTAARTQAHATRSSQNGDYKALLQGLSARLLRPDLDHGPTQVPEDQQCRLDGAIPPTNPA